MKFKNILSSILMVLINASLVLPSTLVQTTDRNRTPNQEALFARYTHNELMSFATSLFDNVDNTYCAYKEYTGINLVFSEIYNSSDLHDLMQDWQIENFPNSENLQTRLEMEIDELVHFHRTKPYRVPPSGSLPDTRYEQTRFRQIR